MSDIMIGIVSAFFVVLFLLAFGTTTETSHFFWHISDVHFDPTYWTEGISCHTDPGPVSSLGRYGHHYCDPPWELVEDSLDEMIRRKPDPAFIIWTGDTNYHFSKRQKTLQDALNVIEKVTDAIFERFPNIPVVPCLGNNDFVPKNTARVSKHPYLDIGALWERWIGNGTNMDHFKRGGYFSKLVAPKLRVMSINTIMYYSKNKASEVFNIKDPAGQFSWMEGLLKDARQEREKVIIIGHIQPGFRTPSLKPMFATAFLRRYIDIMSQYSDVILASHFGHDHADGFKLVQSDGSPLDQAVAAFTALSVTPRQRDSSPSYPHNPSIRLVEYDSATGRHLDYQQFYVNLTDSNTNNKTSWAELYSFRTAYSVPDMSVTSLNAIFNRMIRARIMKDTNSKLRFNSPIGEHPDDPMISYCKYIVGTALPRYCSTMDQAQIWCGMQTSDKKTVDACVNMYLNLESDRSYSGGNGDNSVVLRSTMTNVGLILSVFLVVRFF